MGSFYSLNGSDPPIQQWAVLPSGHPVCVPNSPALQSAKKSVIRQIGGSGEAGVYVVWGSFYSLNRP